MKKNLDCNPRSKDLKEFLQTIYEALLNRQPTESDINFYQMRQYHKKWKSQILCEIATSPEALKLGKVSKLQRPLTNIISVYRVIRHLPLRDFRWQFLPSLTDAHERYLENLRSTIPGSVKITNRIIKRKPIIPILHTLSDKNQDNRFFTSNNFLPQKDCDYQSFSHAGETMQDEFIDEISSNFTNEKSATKGSALSFSDVESYLQYIHGKDQSFYLPKRQNWNYLSDELFVRFLYRWLLHRSPDYDALINYVDHLSHGVSRETILNEIHSSTECSELANKLRADPANITISPFTLNMEALVKTLAVNNQEV